MKIPKYKIGDILIIKYLDHFNVDKETQENCTQEQIGFYVRENNDFIFISLSKHEYDNIILKFEEQVGILKIVILNIDIIKDVK